MKRIALLVVLAVMVAFAAPLMAGQFSDLPENHWAYEAVEKLVAAGIMTGYTDGTFQGKNTLNRFEIAVMLAKLLDQVAAERAILEEKVDALENGLTAGQAEDTIAIFKSLAAKNEEAEETPAPAPAPAPEPTPAPAPEEEQEPIVIEAENLSQAQAEEVATIVEALVMEFKYELQAMGANIEALDGRIATAEGKIADLEGKVVATDGKIVATDGKIAATDSAVKALEGRVVALETAKPVVSWNGSYAVNMTKTQITGTAYTSVFDPTTTAYTTDNDTFNQTLTLGMGINKGSLNATVSLSAVTDLFGTWSVGDNGYLPAISDSDLADTFGLSLSSLKATITQDQTTATVANGQAVTLTDYLLGSTSKTYDGVVVKNGNNSYVLARNKSGIVENRKVLMSASQYDKLVATYGVDKYKNVFDITEYLVAVVDEDGVTRYYFDDTKVVNMSEDQYKTFADDKTRASWDLCNALTQVKDAEGKHVGYTFAVKTADVTTGYTTNDLIAAKQELGILNTTMFVGVESLLDQTFVAGLNSKNTFMGFGLDTTFAFSDKELKNKLFRANVTRNVGPLQLAGGYRHVDDNFAGIYADANIDLTSGYKASATLPVGPLTISGSYDKIIDDEAVINAKADVKDFKFAGFTLNANFEQDIRNNTIDQVSDKATRQKRNVTLNKNLFGLDVNLGYAYDIYSDYDKLDPVYGELVTTNLLVDYYVDGELDHQEYRYDLYGNKITQDVWSADDQLNHVSADLVWKTFIPGLNLSANYIYGLSADDVDGKDLTTHKYAANFAKGIFTAKATQDMVESVTVLGAGVKYSIFSADVEKELNGSLTVNASINPAKYTIAGIGIDPIVTAKLVDKEYNYDLGVDVSKTFKALTLTTGYNYGQHNIYEETKLMGTAKQLKAGLSYALSNSVTASLNYVHQNFKGVGYKEDETRKGQYNSYDATSL